MLTRSCLSVPLAATVSLVSIACGGEDDPATDDLPDEVAVDVLIDDDAGISIEAVYPIEEWRPLAAGGDPTLTWELRAGDAVAAGGQLPDPRIIDAEELGEVRLPFGTTSLRLPSTAGDLVFLEGTAEIGRVAFDPSQLEPQVEDEGEDAEPAASRIGRTRSPLLRAGDVRGAADRIFGNLRRRNAVDLLFLAEGYTERQLEQFRRDARQIARDFRAVMNRQRRYAGRFNIWLQNVRSRASGIDDPRADRLADTAFDITFGSGDTPRRCTWFATADGLAAARRLGRRRGADVVIVLANTAEYGGCAADGIFVVTRSGEAPWTVAHELGHALLGLADEYEPGRCADNAAPNIAYSTRRARIPWGDQIAETTPLPTPEVAENAAILGAFEGANYCENDAFRPQLNCLMRELRRGFDRVCLGRLDRFLAELRRRGDDDGGGGGECGDGNCAEDETDRNCPADCGCASSSCQLPPFGCFCDPQCVTSGDCCADACDACGSC